MREILFFLRSRCCNSGSFSKRPSALILSSSLLLSSLARTHKQKKIHVKQSRDYMIAPKCLRVLRYVCIVSQTVNSKKRRETERGKSEIGTCRSLLHHLFSTTRRAIYSLYRVITMHRPINFANCTLE